MATERLTAIGAKWADIADGLDECGTDSDVALAGVSFAVRRCLYMKAVGREAESAVSRVSGEVACSEQRSAAQRATIASRHAHDDPKTTDKNVALHVWISVFCVCLHPPPS